MVDVRELTAHLVERIGRRRELKKAIEAYWAGKIDAAALDAAAKGIQLTIAKRLQELGSEPSDMSRQQMSEWMRTETLRWGKVVKDNNIKAE